MDSKIVLPHTQLQELLRQAFLKGFIASEEGRNGEVLGNQSKSEIDHEATIHAAEVLNGLVATIKNEN